MIAALSPAAWIGGAVGGAAAFSAVMGWAVWIHGPAQFQAGAAAERGAWQQARIEAIDYQAGRQRVTQAVIDALERDYLDREAAAQAQIQQQRKDLADAQFRCSRGDDGRDYLSDGLSRHILGPPAGD